MKMSFNRYDVLGIAVCAAVASVSLVGVTFAQDASSISGAAGLGSNSGQLGKGFADTVAQALRGNIGLAVGVTFAAFGAYQWLVKQNTAVGIGSILFGALLALVPNLMSGLYNNITSPIVSTLQGSGTGGR